MREKENGMKAIVIKQNGTVMMLDVIENGERLYKTIRQTIDGYMENVYPGGLPKGFVMIVDEEGKLKGKSVNELASSLYEGTIFGDFIVGDVIILKLGQYRGESDVVGIPNKEANDLMNELNRKSPMFGGTNTGRDQ